jgi:D-lyxose ketol-isomerase
MKRSEINQQIREAIQFFESLNFKLPPWAFWSPGQWKAHGGNHDEIIKNQLGWDLTDFGSGNFKACGLLLFTLRNGNIKMHQKPYAEKIMVVEEGQVTPMHFHWSKMEDIINRGGGNLMIQLYPSNEREEFARYEIEVSLDGIKRNLQPGDVLRLQPGESISLFQRLYHTFYGESGTGKVLVGEVSAVNDDHSDNRFYHEVGRFPEIEEDEPIEHLLVGDYRLI